jgi:hypothetical protein
MFTTAGLDALRIELLSLTGHQLTQPLESVRELIDPGGVPPWTIAHTQFVQQWAAVNDVTIQSQNNQITFGLA